VGKLLGLHVEKEPAPYDIGSEPASPRAPRATRRRAPRLDRRLVTPFLPAVRAGVPDADVAKAAGVTVCQVRGWRLRLGIKRRPGATVVARLQGGLLTAPELVQLLHDHETAGDVAVPSPVRFSDQELKPLMEARGLGLQQLREITRGTKCLSNFGRGRR
jgi:hypothetical protein